MKKCGQFRQSKIVNVQSDAVSEYVPEGGCIPGSLLVAISSVCNLIVFP